MQLATDNGLLPGLSLAKAGSRILLPPLGLQVRALPGANQVLQTIDRRFRLRKNIALTMLLPSITILLTADPYMLGQRWILPNNSAQLVTPMKIGDAFL